MKHLVGKQITEKVSFMGDEVEVKKLSVNEVMKVQKIIEKTSKSKSEDAQISLLRDVIKLAVTGASDITDEEFKQFPIGELNSLSEAILRVSGLGNPSAGN